MARTSVWDDPQVKAMMNPELIAAMVASAQIGYPYDRPFMTSVGRGRDLIGEVIIESINSRGTSPRLQALATQKVNEVNDVLRSDGDFR
jgi:multiple sugar transport system substrate-binding protein